MRRRVQSVAPSRPLLRTILIVVPGINREVIGHHGRVRHSFEFRLQAVIEFFLSIFAARMKSLSVKPSILWVQIFISALPQPKQMSG